MKKLRLGLVALGLLGALVFPKVSLANEGTILMKGAGVSGSCFAVSVFVDGSYRVLATCRDLKIALSPEQNRYVVWLNDEEGKTRRLGEIENGKLSSSIDTKFTELFVTAEVDGYGNKPSDTVMLSGQVQAINFVTGEVKPGENVIAAPTPTQSIVKTMPTTFEKETTTKTSETTTVSQGIGGALSTVLKIALFGFGALLLIVGVFSFISRKRSL